MRINQNISAMNTHASMVKSDMSISKSLERLSSGLRINRAADDAAGLAISEKMRGQIRGLQQATRNAQDGISMLQTAEGALNETHSILQRMRELAVQSANDTLTNTDRGEIQKEVDQLTKEIDRIAGSTEFNTKQLLRGTAASSPRASYTNDTAGDLTHAYVGTVTLAGIQAGDTVSIGSTRFKFVTGTPNAAANEVQIGGSNDATADNLATAIDNLLDTNYVVTSPNGTGTVVMTAQSNGANLNLSVSASNAPTSLALTMHIGANAGQSMSVSVGVMDSGSLDIGRDANGALVGSGVNATQGLNVSTQTVANSAITSIDAALSTVSSERSRLGAYQNRLEHTISNLGAASENLSSSESRIRDVDMAEEMANFSKSQILMQASTAMMAQANQKPQAVLKLLG